MTTLQLQLIIAARRVARLGGVVLMVGLLTGCAVLMARTAGGTHIDLSVEEEAFVKDFRARVQVVGESALGCKPNSLFGTCAPRVIAVSSWHPTRHNGQATAPGLMGTYNETAAGRHFVLHQKLIQAAMAKKPAALFILAHEIAHWVHQDPQRILFKRISPEQAELEANASAVWILVTGWGMTQQEAIWVAWSTLIREAGRPSHPPHLSGCSELRDFERRLGLSPYAVEGCAS